MDAALEEVVALGQRVDDGVEVVPPPMPGMVRVRVRYSLYLCRCASLSPLVSYLTLFPAGWIGVR